jgi:hypothetical protein
MELIRIQTKMKMQAWVTVRWLAECYTVQFVCGIQLAPHSEGHSSNDFVETTGKEMQPAESLNLAETTAITRFTSLSPSSISDRTAKTRKSKPDLSLRSVP